jgi:hypothetical protein
MGVVACAALFWSSVPNPAITRAVKVASLPPHSPASSSVLFHHPLVPCVPLLRKKPSSPVPTGSLNKSLGKACKDHMNTEAATTAAVADPAREKHVDLLRLLDVPQRHRRAKPFSADKKRATPGRWKRLRPPLSCWAGRCHVPRRRKAPAGACIGAGQKPNAIFASEVHPPAKRPRHVFPGDR